MIRAVLDTYVLVSGFVRRHPDAPSVRIVDAWRGGLFQLVVCEDIRDEVARTLRKPYFSSRLTETQIDRALILLRRHAFLTPLMGRVQGVASHSEDDRFLDAAVSAGADVLVTGDTDLLALGVVEGLSIVSPRSFQMLLNEGSA